MPPFPQMLYYTHTSIYFLNLPSLLLQLDNSLHGRDETSLEASSPSLTPQPLLLETLSLVEFLAVELVLDLLLPDRSVENSESSHGCRAAGSRVSLLDENGTTGDGLGSDLRSRKDVGVDGSAIAAGLAGDK